MGTPADSGPPPSDCTWPTRNCAGEGGWAKRGATVGKRRVGKEGGKGGRGQRRACSSSMRGGCAPRRAIPCCTACRPASRPAPSCAAPPSQRRPRCKPPRRTSDAGGRTPTAPPLPPPSFAACCLATRSASALLALHGQARRGGTGGEVPNAFAADERVRSCYPPTSCCSDRGRRSAGAVPPACRPPADRHKSKRTWPLRRRGWRACRRCAAAGRCPLAGRAGPGWPARRLWGGAAGAMRGGAREWRRPLEGLAGPGRPARRLCLRGAPTRAWQGERRARAADPATQTPGLDRHPRACLQPP